MVSSGLFPVGLLGSIELEAGLDVRRQLFLASGRGRLGGLLRSRNCLIELAEVGVGSGERIEGSGTFAPSQLDGAFGQAKGLEAVAVLAVGLSAQQPGEIVERFGPVGFEADGFLKVADALGDFISSGQQNANLIV